MTDIAEQLQGLEDKLKATDNLNFTLLQATSAYQIRMAEQEFKIHDQDKEIRELKDLVKQQEIRIVDLVESVERGNW